MESSPGFAATATFLTTSYRPRKKLIFDFWSSFESSNFLENYSPKSECLGLIKYMCCGMLVCISAYAQFFFHKF